LERLVTARLGLAGYGRHGRRGSERSGLAGTSKAGGARFVMARQSMVRHGRHGEAWLGSDRIG